MPWVSQADQPQPVPSAWALSRDEWLPSVVRSSRWEFAADRSAPGEARHAVLRDLRELLEPPEAANLELVVSELVTNAIRHSGSGGTGEQVKVYAAVAPDRMRLEVCDSGPGFGPEARGIRDYDQGFGGVGLILLDVLATVWGMDREHDFCVWAEFARPGPRAVAV